MCFETHLLIYKHTAFSALNDFHLKSLLSQLLMAVLLKRARLLSGALDLNKLCTPILQRHQIRKPRDGTKPYFHNQISVCSQLSDDPRLHFAFQFLTTCHISLRNMMP